jgi:hypothetical protein
LATAFRTLQAERLQFGCKVSVATPVTQPKGGQFVLHVKALHGNPFDAHTLGPVGADMERSPGSPPNVFTSTRATGATTTQTSSASGSAARYPFVAR